MEITMSNEIAVVRFPDGTIMFSGYHGCGSRVNPFLCATLDEAIKDPFSDKEYEAALERATDYDEIEAFYRKRDGREYPNAVEVEVFTPYGDGIYWKDKACKESKFLLPDITDSLEEIGYDSKEEWPEWVLELNVPMLDSLVKDSW